MAMPASSQSVPASPVIVGASCAGLTQLLARLQLANAEQKIVAAAVPKMDATAISLLSSDSDGTPGVPRGVQAAAPGDRPAPGACGHERGRAGCVGGGSQPPAPRAGHAGGGAAPARRGGREAQGGPRCAAEGGQLSLEDLALGSSEQAPGARGKRSPGTAEAAAPKRRKQCNEAQRSGEEAPAATAAQAASAEAEASSTEETSGAQYNSEAAIGSRGDADHIAEQERSRNAAAWPAGNSARVASSDDSAAKRWAAVSLRELTPDDIIDTAAAADEADARSGDEPGDSTVADSGTASVASKGKDAVDGKAGAWFHDEQDAPDASDMACDPSVCRSRFFLGGRPPARPLLQRHAKAERAERAHAVPSTSMSRASAAARRGACGKAASIAGLPQPSEVVAIATSIAKSESVGDGHRGSGKRFAVVFSKEERFLLPCGRSELSQLQTRLAAAERIVVAGARGSDFLKILLTLGAGQLAWTLTIHDVQLMRNALDGETTGVGQKEAAAALSAIDGDHALGLAKSLWRRLITNQGAMASYALEVRAQTMIAFMEFVGLPFDAPGLKRLLKAWQKELEEVEATARAKLRQAGSVADAVKALNFRSPAQIAAAIEKLLPAEEVASWPRTTTGQLCTDSATLQLSRLPFARSVLRFRELQHLLSHYSSYGQLAEAGGGRLFPVYHLGGAVTGRMSCSNPNLHGAPRLPEFRRLFATDGVFVKGDFSQIELRVIAELSGDARMKNAFQGGSDLHAMTAAAVLGVDVAEVTSAERQLAKAVNFGLIFGQSAAGLQQFAHVGYGVELSLSEAHVARKRFFETYPGVADWQKKQKRDVGSGNPISTPSGRVAHHLLEGWRELKSGKAGTDAEQAPRSLQQKRSAAGAKGATLARLEREALNFPVQGGAAEVMLACLDHLRLRLERLRDRCCLVCVVHDEFLLDCIDEDAVAGATEALSKAMKDAWQQIFPQAASLDSAGVKIVMGPTWGSLAEI
eukprot:TRINITY_DN45593_c0_g2_i1.p1 TRINITY_DN45593_c0_g2~~TRINITY_DN45593_c0_g2_i1.p1  ORF type:complete len:982 (-),score=225.64 TRINITY_DN45593_c0_g2_i1:161-3106(-)